ncbi:MAG: hydrogenase maturation protease [Rubripirellula sp.]|nr:hydrogenase maturation protease [Rubripirellula sp.]
MNQDLVIGIGSPHGDDQVGWRVIAHLEQQGQGLAALQTLVDPIDLIEQLEGISRLVIVDGCRSGQEVGMLTRLEADDPRFTEVTGHSTHRISLSETLDLARALGRLPGWVKVFGVEVGQCRPQAAMDPRLEQAVPRIAQEICNELDQRP